VRRGAFVSLHAHGALRGCVGRVAGDRPVAEAVRAMTLAAACDDPRFPPVTRGELLHLRLEIAVLSVPVALMPADPHRVLVGRDGLVIRRGATSGVLLPQVAAAARWSAEHFLVAACRKAGLAAGAWRDPETEVLAFQADVFAE
jgi:AmmeMemoRadiSam system protein A